MRDHTHHRGFIGTLALIVIAIGLLMYFKVDLRGIAQTPQVTQAYAEARDRVIRLWSEYGAVPFNRAAAYANNHHLIENAASFAKIVWQKVSGTFKSLGHM